jgi:drug/metabolite transporter (DMT)-like permease
MERPARTAVLLCTVATFLWSLNLPTLQSSHAAAVPLTAAVFHALFWAALVLLLVLFLSGRTGELAALKYRETQVLFLAATGGYGFWLLGALALQAGSPPRAAFWFCSVPLLIAAISTATGEKADRRAVLGLLVGLAGCWLVARGQVARAQAGPTAGRGGAFLALGASACWALFSVAARPLLREHKALPAAVLVTGLGAVCMLVTCLSMGEGIFDISLSQLSRLAFRSSFSVGLMTVLWLRALAVAPAVLAGPVWYLGAVFGVLWAYRAGEPLSAWWILPGVVLIALGLRRSFAARQARSLTIADVIRG